MRELDAGNHLQSYGPQGMFIRSIACRLVPLTLLAEKRTTLSLYYADDRRFVTARAGQSLSVIHLMLVLVASRIV